MNVSEASVNWTAYFDKLSSFTRTIPAAASPLGGGNGAVTSVPFAFDEVGLLHRESAVLVGQINAKIPRVR